MREKIIQRGYLHIFRGTIVKTKQTPKVRKGEKINAEKYAQGICCLFRSCMSVVTAVAEIKLPVDGADTDYHHLFASALLSYGRCNCVCRILQISIVKSVWLKLRGWC